MNPTAYDAVVLDLDGTLVDSVPVHVLAWQAAFRAVGVRVPSHRIHRAIGMGGDRLVAHVAGAQVETAHGDELRQEHPSQLDRLFNAITPTEGVDELLETLHQHRFRIVLASSSPREITDRLLRLVGDAANLIDETVTASEAEESKPDGELVATAIEKVGARSAVLIGDAVWDVFAARDAGIPCVGLLTGGMSAAELRDAGAVAVHETPLALAEHVRETGLILA